MDKTDFTRTKNAIVVWDRYFKTWMEGLDKLCDSLEPRAFEKNNELVLAYFDTGVKHLCDTVGEAFAADTAGINNRDKVLDVVFMRGHRVIPGVSEWVRELAR